MAEPYGDAGLGEEEEESRYDKLQPTDKEARLSESESVSYSSHDEKTRLLLEREKTTYSSANVSAIDYIHTLTLCVCKMQQFKRHTLSLLS